jgi:hypothetical protein
LAARFLISPIRNDFPGQIGAAVGKTSPARIRRAELAGPMERRTEPGPAKKDLYNI